MAARKPIHVVCFSCYAGQEQTAKKTFLGFPRFACSICGATSEYPLPSLYAVIYATSILLAAISIILGGNPSCFGILALAGIPALAWHARAHKRLRHALANEQKPGERIAHTFR